MTSKTLWLCCLLLALGTTLHAQSYTKGIGARLGFPAGLSYKQFIGNTLAIEGIGGINGINTDRLSYNLTILAVNHSEVLMENLSLMYGGGGHLGSYDEAFEFGVDGILGLEFVFDGAPIAFSFDIKPALSITTNIQPIVGGAFTLRYVF
jgi:hypothetical protein